MRVVIAEDSVLLRVGVQRLLADEGIETVAAVEDGGALLDAVEEHRPDLALVDVRMPPTFTDEGLRAAVEARRRVPGLPVLVLSQYVEERYAVELLAGGANGVGYLLKERVADVSEFVAAVRRVAGGGTSIDHEVMMQLMVRARRNPVDSLTHREREVLG
ncbi:response regulator transcription factor, partial [Saccharothrix sp. MB29]|nr:response regulator transcription factor [Saccharothrix sp. MB29]